MHDLDDSLVSSNTKEHTSEDHLHSEVVGETRNFKTEQGFDTALTNITAAFSLERKDNGKIWNSSFEKKGRLFVLT